jgi:S-(hydroxymethyl)glutathione dehydrogenase / alcohol dehydrogenase
MRSRAGIFRGVGQPFEIVELDLDEPGPTDVVVRMAAVGICGTDLHSVRGEWLRPTPIVLGHEGSGVVERVGSEVERLQPGDEVVLSWAPSCGVCADCRRGRPATCVPLQRAIGNGTLVDGTTGMSLDGETVYRGTATGALSELVVVSERVALPTGGGIPLEHAALLGCAALTGVGAVLFAGRVEPDSSVLVVGAGGVGQFVVQGARIARADSIIAIDPLPERRAQALTSGATHAVDPSDLATTLRDAGLKGVDYAFDAVGDPTTTELALRHTRSGGTTVIVGLPAAGRRLDLDPAELTRREKHLTGTMYGSEDPAVAMPILLDHVRAGRLDLGSLVGPTFPLSELNDAIDASIAGVPGRMLVNPRR